MMIDTNTNQVKPVSRWISWMVGFLSTAMCLLLISCEGDDVNTPSASFTVYPAVGSTSTSFRVDASASENSDSSVPQFEYMWDWERDGVFDTEWRSSFHAYHEYPLLGTYTIRLLVRNSDDQTSETTQSVTITETIQVGEMVSIPAGTFDMGGNASFPVHEVVLTNNYQLGKFEVTNQEFIEVMQWAYDQGLVSIMNDEITAYDLAIFQLGKEIVFSDGEFGLQEDASDYFYGSPHLAYPDGYNPAKHPVFGVSWPCAFCYCDWLSLMHDLPAFYQGNWDHVGNLDPYVALGYRLPTEAEWEYAARFNDGRNYPWGNTPADYDYANFRGSVNWTTSVGSYPQGRSQLGLHDMAGNLEEWVGDTWTAYSDSTQVNPYYVTPGRQHVARGGDWHRLSMQIFSTDSYAPMYTTYFSGFRVCKTEF